MNAARRDARVRSAWRGRTGHVHRAAVRVAQAVTLRSRGLEAALAQGTLTSALVLGVAGWLGGWRLAAALAVGLVVGVAGIHAAVPPAGTPRRARWSAFGDVALAAFGVGALASALLGGGAVDRVQWLAVAQFAALVPLAGAADGKTLGYAELPVARHRATVAPFEDRRRRAAAWAGGAARGGSDMDRGPRLANTDLTRAWRQGYRAGRRVRSPEANPYNFILEPRLCLAWDEGFGVARSETASRAARPSGGVAARSTTSELPRG